MIGFIGMSSIRYIVPVARHGTVSNGSKSKIIGEAPGLNNPQWVILLLSMQFRTYFHARAVEFRQALRDGLVISNELDK